MQCAAVCCSVLQCVAVCCSVLQCAAVCCNTPRVPCVTWRVFRLQCVAACCSVLQCFAVFRSVLQCVATHLAWRVILIIMSTCNSYHAGNTRARRPSSSYSSSCLNIIDPLNPWIQSSASTPAPWQHPPTPHVNGASVHIGGGRGGGGQGGEGKFAGGALWAGGPRSRSGASFMDHVSRSYKVQEALRRKAVPPTVPAGKHVCIMCYDRARTVQNAKTPFLHLR